MKEKRPEKKTSWNKNPSPEDRVENARLRNLLVAEKSSGVVCAELVGENRLRAEKLLKKSERTIKVLERRGKLKLFKKLKEEKKKISDADSVKTRYTYKCILYIDIYIKFKI